MSTSPPRHAFRRVTAADLPLINEWQRRPRVAEWWDETTLYTTDDLHDRRLALWIVEHDRRPFAFIQDYAVHGWDGHPFAYLPPRSRGIDQFIADPLMLGVGHGTAFIRLHLARLFADGVPIVGTDPHPQNGRAIAAYKKVGFEVVSDTVETPWGPSLLMECADPSFSRS